MNAAITQLNHNNNVAACNQLNAFLNQVNAKQTNGQLTLQQAAVLRQQATSIQHAIGCSSSTESTKYFISLLRRAKKKMKVKYRDMLRDKL